VSTRKRFLSRSPHHSLRPERDHRVDAAGAAGGDPAGEEGDREEREGDEREGDRVGGAYAFREVTSDLWPVTSGGERGANEQPIAASHMPWRTMSFCTSESWAPRAMRRPISRVGIREGGSCPQIAQIFTDFWLLNLCESGPEGICG